MGAHSHLFAFFLNLFSEALSLEGVVTGPEELRVAQAGFFIEQNSPAVFANNL